MAQPVLTTWTRCAGMLVIASGLIACQANKSQEVDYGRDMASKSIFPIVIGVSVSDLPLRWQPHSIIRPLSPPNFADAVRVIEAELSKYPEQVLASVVSLIILFDELELSGIQTRGSYDGTTIYLAYSSAYTEDQDMLEAGLCITVHHEIMTVIIQKHFQNFSISKWIAQNPPHFAYIGTASLATHDWSQWPSSDRDTQQAFVSAYALFSFENDVAETAASLMMPEWFRDLTDAPAARSKQELVKRILLRIDPSFDSVLAYGTSEQRS